MTDYNAPSNTTGFLADDEVAEMIGQNEFALMSNRWITDGFGEAKRAVGIDRVSETLQLLHDYELGRKYGKTYTYNDVKYNLEDFKQDILEDVDFYEALKAKIINTIKGERPKEEEKKTQLVIDYNKTKSIQVVVETEPKLFDKI